MFNKKSSKFISLQEATKFCDYSQEYLSLRARQKKLKAIKIGRNWVTKEEWVEEYLAKVEEYKNNLNNLKIEKLEERVIVPEEAPPPLNLPIDEFEAVKLSQPLCLHKLLYEDERRKAKSKVPMFRFRFALGLILVLVVVAGIFAFKTAPEEISFKNVIVEKTSESIKNFVAVIGSGNIEDILKSTFKTFGEYGQWVKHQIFALGRSLKKMPEKIAQEFKSISKLWRKPEKREGMVVVPSTEKDEEVKKKIRAVFSDEVKVKPEDKSSGIIVPIFRDKVGEEYIYVLVPTKE